MFRVAQEAITNVARHSHARVAVISIVQLVGQVRLQVIDDGGGIPAAARAQIFDPFFTTKDRGLGLGLGLALCHRIVEEHRGAIHVDSTEGRGTIVTCFLPVAR